MNVAPLGYWVAGALPLANVALAGFGYGLDESEPNVLIPIALNAASRLWFCS